MVDSKTKRPKEIDEFLALDVQIKSLTAKKDGMKDKIREYLENSEYPDLRLIEVNTEKIDAEKAMKWSKANLALEIYKSLFIKQFNLDAFSGLITAGQVSKKLMVKLGILTKTLRKDIRCFHGAVEK